MRKQKEIKKALAQLGWSNTTLADLVHEEKYNGEIEATREELKKQSEAIKKHLQRKTTSEDLLEFYLRVIHQHPDYQNLGLDTVLPSYVDHECLGLELSMKLKDLSNDIDELIASG
ncbi:elongation factor Ts [Veronia nyctiphanis]|uniref:elongation factor Ts n=1 Tax=Veronia nyctiphanis TaxID=1278244 RepID=UPI00100A7681|nr:elongation factor Ts [Veronia nyctiphanis]